MNGLDTILKRLDDQATAEISGILAQAQVQADAITAEYAAKAEALEASMTQATAQEVESLGSRMESASDMEGRKAILGAKQDMVAQAFDKAEQAILNLNEAEYVAFLANALVAAAPNGEGAVIFAQKDKGAVAEAVLAAANAQTKGGFTLSAEERAISGGFVLVDKTMEINATVETLVRLARGQWAGQVAKLLFG
ncbi:V-type ATP synthase subunit E [Bengtsoniella intestinalis]|uniref:V-type ATP synthase subunit E n=1 Tax=Bengtsoniella intestinalis TaxID=3073143 RepID=UPI00391EFD45